MRSGFLLPASLLIGLTAVSAAGCTIGEGSGTATGTLFVIGCYPEAPHDLGSEAAPEPFDLSPSYFAGEPIEDTADAKPAHNRLIMRMQRNGNALEINDVIYVDVPFSYQIAQCLRGRTVGGLPDWDTSTGTAYPGVTEPWCGPIGPNGVPRINLAPYGPVRVSLTPFWTCHSQAHPPTVVSVTGMAAEGWIDFLAFGSAAQPSLPPEERTPVDLDFKVNYGDQLHAIFQFTMLDERITNAIRLGLVLPPSAVIGGALQGEYDFDLDRGRSAQTFP
jgi:hypothetical protein